MKESPASITDEDTAGAQCSFTCFGSAMETKASRMVLSESESVSSKFKRRIKPKNKDKSSKPTPFSNYDVKISPNCVISGKSEALVKIVSISRDEEMIPVTAHGEGTSSKRQPAKKKKKKPLGFDAAENKISGGEKGVSMRKLNHRSWVRIAKAFLFPTDPKSRNELKVSQKSSRRDHAKDEQPKAQETRQENEIRDSIPRPIGQQYSKSSRASEEVESKSCKMLKSIDFHRKVTSHANAPNSPFIGRGIESAPRFSSSSSSQLPNRNMAMIWHSPTPDLLCGKLNVSAPVAERKGSIAGCSGDVTGEGEGYGLAINLWVLIIIMGCLVVFTDRLLAVVCASAWWYLVPCLLKRFNVVVLR